MPRFHAASAGGFEPPPTEPFSPPPPGSADSLFAPATAGQAPSSAPPPSYPGAGAQGAPRPGDRLGDFELLAKLGEGGFGEVFLARQVSLGREVALKVSADARGEARALARLEHESIVRVYDQATDWERNLRLLWMQYVPGASLERVIRRLARRAPEGWDGQAILEAVAAASPGPAAADHAARRDRERLEGSDFASAVCWLGARLAEALAHAHAQGVVHRDVKPANILLSRSGRPFLADFNLAFQPHAADGPGGQGVGGTVRYMAPEHLDAYAQVAPPEAVGARSDVYSLGVVLFELLTGRRPFEDPAPDLPVRTALADMAAERRAGAPSPRRLRPEVPEVLDRAVRRCLDPDPARRYQAAELADALDGCRELLAAHKQMPPAGPLTRAAVTHPMPTAIWLVLLPHLFGASVDLGYNVLWLAGTPDGGRLALTFVALALGYSAAAFSVTGWLTVRLCRPTAELSLRLRAGETMDAASVDALRRRSLWNPWWGMVLSGIGWLPGGVLMPVLLSWLAGPLDWAVYLHLALSFTIAGMIALTYNALASWFLVLRVGYPRLWVDASGLRESARVELRGVEGRLWLVQLLSCLVPLAAGAALMAGLRAAGPEQVGTPSYRTFQALVIGLTVLGMAGCWLAVSISRRLTETLTALTGGERLSSR
jgi:serine/threonine protein kinase